MRLLPGPLRDAAVFLNLTGNEEEAEKLQRDSKLSNSVAFIVTYIILIPLILVFLGIKMYTLLLNTFL